GEVARMMLEQYGRASAPSRAASRMPPLTASQRIQALYAFVVPILLVLLIAVMNDVRAKAELLCECDEHPAAGAEARPQQISSPCRDHAAKPASDSMLCL
ncbi:MAG TPA: hypothetical protein VKY38_04935, partial [Azoarcus sp.]|nr:hypothetical protein [Azoarcus sp.]